MIALAARMKSLETAALSILPDGPRIAIKRRFRGIRERKRLSQAELVVIGHPKSGNTWMRFQLARLYQKKYDLDETLIPRVEALHALNSSIPQLHMGAYNYIKPILIGPAPAPQLVDKAVVFIVRHPLDILVSLYFHVQKHALHERKLFNDWPLDLNNVSMAQFALESNWGLRPLISFFNDCMRQQSMLSRSMVLSYESMRSQPVESLMEVAKLVGAPVSLAEAEEATAFSSFENLRKAEVDNRFNTTRLRAANPEDPDSFKVRRGKVFGFRDHFSDIELQQLERIIDEELDPRLGYSTALS